MPSASDQSLQERFRSASVTVAVLNYNGMEVLPGCLESVETLRSDPAEVLLIDDGSSDGSPEWVRRTHPHVRVVALEENTGRLNVVRNVALRNATSEFVLLVDNDVRLAPDVVDRLLDAMARLPQAAVCSPRTLFEHDPSTIYQDGQTLHFVAATPALNRGVPLASADDRPRLTIGWGVQLIDRQQALRHGGFNEQYVMGWGDDGEFNHRMNLAGHFCYHVPDAIVFHRRVAGARRYYGTVRNRWRFILECYQLRTLVVCAPALLLYELSVLGFLTAKGALRDYLRAVLHTFLDLPSIMASRSAIQRTRRVPDRELMRAGDIYIAREYVDQGTLSRSLSALNRFLNGYWRAARSLL